MFKKMKIKQKIVGLLTFGWHSLNKRYPRTKDYDIGNNNRLYYWRMMNGTENLGDYLSKIVVDHFVPVPKTNKSKNRGKTLYAIGSILGFRCQNAVVWGSGILVPSYQAKKNIQHSSLDIRAVRGPKTRELLCEYGKNVLKYMEIRQFCCR